MIKGKRKRSYEEVLQLTNNGYDVYMAFEGKVSKQMSCPWRRDIHPSFGIFQREGMWFWRDMVTEETGTAVDYVMKKFGLTFPDALEKILYTFGWSQNKVNSKPVMVTWEKEEVQPVHIAFRSKPFEKGHHLFWNKAGVQEADCKGKECWALKDVSVNRKRYPLKKDEIAFAFYCPEEDKVKLYFPEREKGKKFLNNVSFFHLWNFSNIENCPDLIIQKSPKDMVVTSLITPCVIATQAEAVKIFNEEVVGRINSVAKNVWVFYGSDPDGVKKCQEITGKLNYKYINTPKKYLPDVNDVYGMACLFNGDLKPIEDFMRSKKFPI